MIVSGTTKGRQQMAAVAAVLCIHLAHGKLAPEVSAAATVLEDAVGNPGGCPGHARRSYSSRPRPRLRFLKGPIADPRHVGPSHQSAPVVPHAARDSR
jgi:hypothetical protein